MCMCVCVCMYVCISSVGHPPSVGVAKIKPSRKYPGVKSTVVPKRTETEACPGTNPKNDLCFGVALACGPPLHLTSHGYGIC